MISWFNGPCCLSIYKLKKNLFNNPFSLCILCILCYAFDVMLSFRRLNSLSLRRNLHMKSNSANDKQCTFCFLYVSALSFISFRNCHLRAESAYCMPIFCLLSTYFLPIICLLSAYSFPNGDDVAGILGLLNQNNDLYEFQRDYLHC